MSKGGQTVRTTQNQTSAVDPQTQRYVQMMRDRAMTGMNDIGSANLGMGVNPMLQQAMQGIAGFQAPQMTAAGINADTMSLMNPFMGAVIDPTRAEFDHLRGQASTQANAMATQAGAFGGSRHGVMQGARLGEIDRGQASQIANMLMGGFNQAQQGAFNIGNQNLQASGQQLGALGMGLQGGGMMQGIDQYNAQVPIMRQNAMMNLGMGSIGPYGQTMSGNMTQQMPGANPLTQLLGAGLTIGGMFMGRPAGGMGALGGGAAPSGIQNTIMPSMPQIGMAAPLAGGSPWWAAR